MWSEWWFVVVALIASVSSVIRMALDLTLVIEENTRQTSDADRTSLVLKFDSNGH